MPDILLGLFRPEVNRGRGDRSRFPSTGLPIKDIAELLGLLDRFSSKMVLDVVDHLDWIYRFRDYRHSTESTSKPEQFGETVWFPVSK